MYKRKKHKDEDNQNNFTNKEKTLILIKKIIKYRKPRKIWFVVRKRGSQQWQ